MIAIRDLFRPDSRFPGLASVAAVTLYCILFLHAESQGAVMGLLAGALVGLPLLARFDWTQRVSASFTHHPRLAHGAVLAGVIIVLAAFHDQHFPLLMLATVLLYIVVCLGLNVQFGYAGVLNFAGSAFFGVGAYTSAVLATQTALPHLLVVATGGVLAALIGSLLILPLLRTRGHYAALITIAFSLLFKTLIEVNDALGGPQGLKVPGLNLFGWNLNAGLAIGGVELSFYANYVVLALAHLLTAIGFAAMIARGDPLRDTLLFVRFAQGVVVGTVLMAAVSLVPLRRTGLSAFSLIPLGAACLLSVLLILFGSGPSGSNAKVNLGPIQPIEAIRVLIALFLAGSAWYFLQTRWYLFPLLYLNFGYFADRFVYVQDGSYLVMLTCVLAALVLTRRGSVVAAPLLMAVATTLKLLPIAYARYLPRLARRSPKGVGGTYVAILIAGLVVPFFVWENYGDIYQFANERKGNDWLDILSALLLVVPFTLVLWYVEDRRQFAPEDRIGSSLVPFALLAALVANSGRHVLIALIVPDRRAGRNIAAAFGLLLYSLLPGIVQLGAVTYIATAVLGLVLACELQQIGWRIVLDDVRHPGRTLRLLFAGRAEEVDGETV